MHYSDFGIRDLIEQKSIHIEPLFEGALRPASVCLHLSNELVLFSEESRVPVDPENPTTYPMENRVILEAGQSQILHPNQFILGATIEKVGLSAGVAGLISNISGLARLGLTVALSTHVAPGFGTDSPKTLTLEIHNVAPFPILVRAGMRICHLMLHSVTPHAATGYDQLFPEKYSGLGPIGSQFSL